MNARDLFTQLARAGRIDRAVPSLDGLKQTCLIQLLPSKRLYGLQHPQPVRTSGVPE